MCLTTAQATVHITKENSRRTKKSSSVTGVAHAHPKSFSDGVHSGMAPVPPSAGQALSRQNSVSPQLELVVKAGAPVPVSLVHHASRPSRNVGVFSTQHETLLEPLESSVSHVLEARELRLKEGETHQRGQGA